MAGMIQTSERTHITTELDSIVHSLRAMRMLLPAGSYDASNVSNVAHALSSRVEEIAARINAEMDRLTAAAVAANLSPEQKKPENRPAGTVGAGVTAGALAFKQQAYDDLIKKRDEFLQRDLTSSQLGSQP